MSSEEDAALPEHADDRPVEGDDEEEEQEAPSRSFGAALSAILADTRTGGPALPPGTQRKRAAEKAKMKELQEARETKRKLLEKDRVVPEPSAAAYERRLMKVATRGVVRLFNAVAAQRAAHDAEKEDEEEDTKPQSKAGAWLNLCEICARWRMWLLSVPRALSTATPCIPFCSSHLICLTLHTAERLTRSKFLEMLAAPAATVPRTAAKAQATNAATIKALDE